MMKIQFCSVILVFFCMVLGHTQVVLNANGEGNTYEDINAVLAPNRNAIEVPDCAHTDFGRHIDEVFDKDLNTHVFRFIAHVNEDNDRCKKFDRQRIEIKTYSSSPDHLKAIEGETVEYKWEFMLPSDFKASKNFTHLHQIKSVGSEFSSRPIITLTARKGNPDRLELRYTPIYDQSTIKSIDLDLLRGQWVKVTEVIHYTNKGSYSIEIKKISNDFKLFEYSNESIDMWQDGAQFSRPKWGIYRSLKHKEDLKDEFVYFNSFSIDEIPEFTLELLEEKADPKQYKVASKKGTLNFKNVTTKDYDEFQMFNSKGDKIAIKGLIKKQNLNVLNLEKGSYYIVFTNKKRLLKVLKYSIE